MAEPALAAGVARREVWARAMFDFANSGLYDGDRHGDFQRLFRRRRCRQRAGE